MPEPSPRHYRFESYRLDTQTRELRDGEGAVVALTAKAFDTLCFLIENRQRVVGKEELLAAVWPGRVVEDNNLTQAIATLRRALGTDASDHRYIVTVPGRGYRFVAEVEEGDGAMRWRAPRSRAVTAARTAAAAPTPAWRRAITVGAVLFMLALFAVAAWRMREAPAPLRAARRRAQRTALAVLPFRSLSSGPRDEGLELGLADTLITRLSRSSALQVRALASSQRLAGDDAGAEGRRPRAGCGLRRRRHDPANRRPGAGQCAAVVGGGWRQVWAETFDAPIDAVFTLQDRIGDAVTSALALAPVVVPARSRSPCDGADAAAYRAYLRG